MAGWFSLRDTYIYFYIHVHGGNAHHINIQYAKTNKVATLILKPNTKGSSILFWRMPLGLLEQNSEVDCLRDVFWDVRYLNLKLQNPLHSFSSDVWRMEVIALSVMSSCCSLFTDDLFPVQHPCWLHVFWLILPWDQAQQLESFPGSAVHKTYHLSVYVYFGRDM